MAFTTTSEVAASLPKKQQHKYKFLKHIGSGSFGEIYLGANTETEESVAIKVESRTVKNPQLFLEYHVYRKLLSGVPGFPAVHDFVQSTRFNYFAMTLLGENLERLFERCGRRFSDKTILMIADQMVSRIQDLHEVANFVHRDIKPENFLMGLSPGKSESVIHLVDLGLSKTFVDRRTGVHIVPTNTRRSLTGTPRYASVSAHHGRDQSRRDDLESTAYVLIYFATGRLPWQGLKTGTKKERYDKIGEMKLLTSTDKLCSGLMPELKCFLNYVNRLTFEERPDYQNVRQLFRNGLTRGGLKDDGMFDWINMDG